MTNKRIEKIYAFTIITVLIVLGIIIIFGTKDSKSIFVVFKDAAKWNKDWMSWASFVGVTLLIPLGTYIGRSIVLGFSYFSKFAWYLTLILAGLGVILILFGFVFGPT